MEAKNNSTNTSVMATWAGTWLGFKLFAWIVLPKWFEFEVLLLLANWFTRFSSSIDLRLPENKNKTIFTIRQFPDRKSYSKSVNLMVNAVGKSPLRPLIMPHDQPSSDLTDVSILIQKQDLVRQWDEEKFFGIIFFLFTITISPSCKDISSLRCASKLYSTLCFVCDASN